MSRRVPIQKMFPCGLRPCLNRQVDSTLGPEAFIELFRGYRKHAVQYLRFSQSRSRRNKSTCPFGIADCNRRQSAPSRRCPWRQKVSGIRCQVSGVCENQRANYFSLSRRRAFICHSAAVRFYLNTPHFHLRRQSAPARSPVRASPAKPRQARPVGLREHVSFGVCIRKIYAEGFLAPSHLICGKSALPTRSRLGLAPSRRSKDKSAQMTWPSGAAVNVAALDWSIGIAGDDAIRRGVTAT